MHYIVVMRVNGFKQFVIIDSLNSALEHVVKGARLIAFSESPVPKEFLRELVIASRAI